MNFSRYFVDRPILASVLSLLILIAGLLAMFKLPIAEYAEVSPPSIVVNAFFPGANPSEISETALGSLPGLHSLERADIPFYFFTIMGLMPVRSFTYTGFAGK